MKKTLHPFPAPPRDGSTLWYLSPAPESYSGWENAALPVGNGWIGAKMFGGITEEHLQFNEKSLWSGGPDVPGSTGGNSKCDKGASLRKIQALLKNEDFAGATEMMRELQGNETGLGAYQNFGDLYMRFHDLEESRVQNYIRDLDLKNAEASVTFQYDGAEIKRQCFVNYPHNVLVCRITASGAQGLNFTVRLESAQHGEVRSAGNAVYLSGTVTEWLNGKPGANANSLRYAAKLYAAADGSVTANGDGTLTVKNAKETTLYLCAGTDYKMEYPLYRSGADPMDTVKNLLEQAVSMGYPALREEHTADFRALFDRMQLHLGENTPNLPTDELLSEYRRGVPSKALELLYFQYGRYLLISSSRQGALPANLQGIWNAKNNPPWQSDYHLNVNMQMIYWPAMVTNLKETMPPMLAYMNSLREPGRITAFSYTGVGAQNADGSVNTREPTGWMTHTQNNIFGNTGPGSAWRWGWAPTAGAWMTQNMYDYYTFTRDLTALKEQIYPAMEECALLWSKLLVEDPVTGRLVSSPSFSPENGPVSAGNTFDQELIWQLYENTREAAEALTAAGMEHCVCKELVETITAQQKRLRPLQVGSWGQIKEWPQEDTWKSRGFRSQGVEKNHRHLSHLLGVYPGSHITAATPEWFQAAKVSIIDRQNIPWYKKWNPMLDTGWSKAQKICAWARLREGARSYHTFQQLLRHSTLDNLWDTHPPFQMDGNLGACAGIAELLLQSHTGVIDLLPALPEEWQGQGAVRGICARGGFTLDFEWSRGELTSLTVTAGCDGPCVLHSPGLTAKAAQKNGEPVEFQILSPDRIAFEARRGGVYPIVV